ncbi:MAG TPA: TIGR02281 family clan AA aspartic protease [Allosphingosinicella sp.]|nr:TIGR02281 family clan AA aspartic protease [Allosphingosinicella sp.]
MSAGSTLAWAGLGLIGVAFLAPSLQRAEAPPAVAAEQPGPAAAPASAQAGNGLASRELVRDADGHFYAEAQVNGARIRFMVDTGASVVALTPADAQRAGIALPSERATARGAGGEVEVIPVTIERIALGPIEARSVRGAVAAQLPVSLLGQSFMSQIGSVEIRGDRMVLR